MLVIKIRNRPGTTLTSTVPEICNKCLYDVERQNNSKPLVDFCFLVKRI